ncbi:aldehyde dehydrogenase family protein [Streptomonospora litoralis]|uniref:Succinate-semialdehyde dehydrogenase [NADP(+)] GabD n=1 Tax=Streptomonospora litoralis TaxID=2498135 RepID=A0A4P6PY29_9ACTN|nr:aldehyde dehydrogenase family protein [Streptomonospora litoralis]QBI53013.1 Succinate-semialdehyde dehydrogenase [NADP(+)] GabD [Streptomonospora litoralis]
MPLINSYLGGEHAAGGRVFTVSSPVDGAPVAEVAAADRAVVDAAADAGARAYRADAASTPHQRRDRCQRVARELTARREEVARTVTAETGRPYLGALAEVDKAAEGFLLAGEEAVRLTGATVPVAQPGKLVFTRWRPTGVWAIATPWNFPINIPVEYLGPILATGNAAVWKPAPTTVASSALLMECLIAAGIPDGQVTMIATDDAGVAEHLVSHPGIVGVGLTGSTPTGNAVARSAAGKRTVLELGGNGPILVYADADLDRAAEAIAASCFTASGQICSAGGRILADVPVAAELAEAVAERSREYPLGDPYDEHTRVGPLHLPELAAEVEARVEQAQRDGAAVLTGGRRSPGYPTDQYIAATVLRDVPAHTPLNRNETFGPVAPIVPLASDRLVAESNAGAHALSAAVFTRDIGRALTALESLEFGSVAVNDRSTYWELHLPFGGWEGKASGTGRVGVPDMVRALCQPQTVSLDGR